MTTSARGRVADFWDDELMMWRAGDVPRPGSGLRRWFDSYSGKGAGAVDTAHYPDPYVGDLRGVRAEPRLVVLGLNPGVGYDRLQGDEGTWTRRIRQVGYSRCFERSPAEDPESWKELHEGRPSVFWRNLETFAQRWLDDPGAGVADILNFELYPWHSKKIQGLMRPPTDLLDELVWQPTAEVAVDEVFAFGAVWFEVCDALGLPVEFACGPKADGFPDGNRWSGWRLSGYRLPSGQLAVVSAQPGFSGPPAMRRLRVVRDILKDHRAGGAS